jgi:cytochrome P450
VRAGFHVYFLNRPDLIEFVLVRNHSKLLKDRVQNSRWFFGDGLLTSEGEEWKRQRRLAQPAYYRERVASYAGIMTDYTEQMLSGWRDGAIIDVHQEMMNLTLRIVVRTLFGVEAENTDKISGALNTMMRQTDWSSTASSAGCTQTAAARHGQSPSSRQTTERRCIWDHEEGRKRVLAIVPSNLSCSSSEDHG